MKTFENGRRGIKRPCGRPQASTFLLFQYVLRTLSIGDAYKYKLNSSSSCTICATEYNMGWN